MGTESTVIEALENILEFIGFVTVLGAACIGFLVLSGRIRFGVASGSVALTEAEFEEFQKTGILPGDKDPGHKSDAT
jgi:hypothetical protein